MTEKAKRVLNKPKVTRLFPSPETRDRALEQFNRENLDDVQPMGGDKSDQLLRDMNLLEADHAEFVKSLAP